MYCPRCGSPNEPGDRYCSSCGAQLREAKPPSDGGSRDRVGALVGETRAARLATAGTLVALVVAVVAFIALDPADDGTPRDAYTLEAERICLDAKQQMVESRRRAGAADPSAYAEGLVPIVGTWRRQLGELRVPGDRVQEARRLEAALLEAQIRVAGLARAAGGRDRPAALASAKRADEAATEVEEAVSALGLEECSSLVLGLSPEPS